MNELIDIYINNGFSLFKQEESTVIISTKLSMRVLDILEGLNVLVLGGDIYRKSGDDFEHTYDNWYYAGNVHSESLEVARQYLDNLKEQELYVSFVFK
ncbi:Imm40 family immunity protein [Haemophilus parainfluenzae]|jgi:hypothetical protein|uniref:Immunity protein 40 domain-containing protein n=1 Tax=Haemophilus parainfluenzae TaxID=729 RepID=A0A7M1NUS7_HAEPA|nr:Imm40 family immunity protein [Haemophilus parainfluenzae]QOR16712.1 hypothetical protein INP94_07430 [Haemophilus parainfluenzae]